MGNVVSFLSKHPHITLYGEKGRGGFEGSREGKGTDGQGEKGKHADKEKGGREKGRVGFRGGGMEETVGRRWKWREWKEVGGAGIWMEGKQTRKRGRKGKNGGDGRERQGNLGGGSGRKGKEGKSGKRRYMRGRKDKKEEERRRKGGDGRGREGSKGQREMVRIV